MVEGHQCHRVAAAHRKLLVGHAFKATSPNGRFIEGAAAVNNRPLEKIEVHGKNLFYFFSKDATPSKKLQPQPSLHEIVHVHFGMAGAFKTMKPPGVEPTATTRLRLENPKLNVIAHLSAMTVIHGDDEYYKCATDMPCAFLLVRVYSQQALFACRQSVPVQL
jgi:formamidopyrimidine-DNA glycosylase